MEFNRATLSALITVGVLAIGGGAFIANRQTNVPLAEPQQINLPAVAGSVNETENSIATLPAAVEPQPQATNSVAAQAPVSPAPGGARPAQRVSRPSPTAALERPRPVTAIPAAPAAPSAPVDPPVTAAIEPVESTTVENVPLAPQPPEKQYEELVVPADSVIGLQIDTAVTSDRAKVEDPVRARVTRDVKVRDYMAIPAGARAEGSITLVEKGGRLKDQARLGIRFHTIVLADGTRLSINTETIYRDGESPAKESAAKIGGGAVGGAVLGAILGGKKGAIIGTTIGAGAGGAAVAASDANPATLPAGSTVTVRMSSPASVTVEK
ncbi:MAG: TrbI/VirB10 family protein [Acidobacteria bacterium]|nr:TrbI/VirB10 family protein [Acidobacteriota bacterium]